VRLKSLLYLVSLTPDPLRTHGRPSVQECRLRLKRTPPNAARRCPFKSSTAYPRSCASCLFPWAAALCFAHARKNMSQHIFRSSVELQNSREGGLRTLASFSVRERPARYGSSALSGVEHLRLLVGRNSAVDTLLRPFGSLKELERAFNRAAGRLVNGVEFHSGPFERCEEGRRRPR